MVLEVPTCKTCNTLMGKAGYAPSGTKKIQRWRCSKCGRVTTKGDASNSHHNRIVIDFSDLQLAQLQVRSLKTSTNISAYVKTYLFREH